MGSDSPFHLPETGRNWLFPYTRCWDWPKAPFILCNHHRPSMMSVLLSIFKRLRKQGPKWFSSFLLSTVAQSLHLVSLSCVIPLYLERWMLVVGFYPEPFQHAPKSVLKSRAIMECYNSLSLFFYYIHLLIHSSGKGAHSTAHVQRSQNNLHDSGTWFSFYHVGPEEPSFSDSVANTSTSWATSLGWKLFFVEWNHLKTMRTAK